ncbi:MAG: hypothetical protein LBQ49_01835 [Rickettsiales bacterium]|nr:hypothetical protein [Rickettsiales bacterium]
MKEITKERKLELDAVLTAYFADTTGLVELDLHEYSNMERQYISDVTLKHAFGRMKDEDAETLKRLPESERHKFKPMSFSSILNLHVGLAARKYCATDTTLRARLGLIKRNRSLFDRETYDLAAARLPKGYLEKSLRGKISIGMRENGKISLKKELYAVELAQKELPKKFKSGLWKLADKICEINKIQRAKDPTITKLKMKRLCIRIGSRKPFRGRDKERVGFSLDIYNALLPNMLYDYASMDAYSRAAATIRAKAVETTDKYFDWIKEIVERKDLWPLKEGDMLPQQEIAELLCVVDKKICEEKGIEPRINRSRLRYTISPGLRGGALRSERMKAEFNPKVAELLSPWILSVNEAISFGRTHTTKTSYNIRQLGVKQNVTVSATSETRTPPANHAHTTARRVAVSPQCH